MKTKDLIEELSRLDQNANVLLVHGKDETDIFDVKPCNTERHGVVIESQMSDEANEVITEFKKELSLYESDARDIRDICRTLIEGMPETSPTLESIKKIKKICEN